VFAEGEHARFELPAPPGGRPLAFEWRAPVAATASVLAVCAGDYFIQFVRRRGQVTEFEITDGRVRRVTFERVARQRPPRGTKRFPDPTLAADGPPN